MPRLLLVAGNFPPSIGGPADQMRQRVKYLTRLGWDIDVLTPTVPEGSPVLAEAPDLGASVSVHRTDFLLRSSYPSLRHDKERPAGHARRRWRGLSDLLFVPGGYLRWLPSAVRTGRRLVRRADVMHSVSNPITAHVAAWAIRLGSGCPWVAELRDPIAGYSHSHRGPEVINRRFERWLARVADGLVQWGDFFPEPMAERYPDQPPEKFCVLPQSGFDSDDFEDYRHDAPADGPLRICYTGAFYGDAITPIPFLRALAAARARCGADAVDVVFAGDWSTEYDRLVQEHGLDDCVRALGRISRAECRDLWQRSHVLLVILGDQGDDVGRIPSKFWDYVAAGATILALVAPQGRVAGLMRSERLGLTARSTDVNAIASAITQLVERHRSGKLRPHRDPRFVASVTRARSEAMLTAFLQERAGLAGEGRRLTPTTGSEERA